MQQKIDLISIEVNKDCMKNFSKGLKEHATKIINYEKKEIIPLTYEESKSYKKRNVFYIRKKE